MNKDFKNWLFAILFVIGAIADLGFDALAGIVKDLDLNPKVIVWIRLIVIIYGSVKLKLQPPEAKRV